MILSVLSSVTVLQTVDNAHICKTPAFPEACFSCFKASLGQSDSVSSHFPLLPDWCLEGRLLFLQKQLPGSLFLSSAVGRGLQKDSVTWRPAWRFDSRNWPWVSFWRHGFEMTTYQKEAPGVRHLCYGGRLRALLCSPRSRPLSNFHFLERTGKGSWDVPRCSEEHISAAMGRYSSHGSVRWGLTAWFRGSDRNQMQSRAVMGRETGWWNVATGEIRLGNWARWWDTWQVN